MRRTRNAKKLLWKSHHSILIRDLWTTLAHSVWPLSSRSPQCKSGKAEKRFYWTLWISNVRWPNVLPFGRTLVAHLSKANHKYLAAFSRSETTACRPHAREEWILAVIKLQFIGTCCKCSIKKWIWYFYAVSNHFLQRTFSVGTYLI